ncbi:MAG: endolytic transglycosylase MltG [Alphaproteobacteria bacterium]|nr:endolytic transglycosylase MltG [Alphaproteobacteria bacterium]
MNLLKCILGLWVYVFTAGVLSAVAGFYWIAHEYTRPGPYSQVISFEALPGQGVHEIAQSLREAGTFRNDAGVYVFEIGARLFDARGTLKAGEYELPPAASIQSINLLLQSGKVMPRLITIPEGITSYEIVEILNAIPHLEGEISAPPPEGSLLPETYSTRRGESRTAVLERLREAMDKLMAELWPGHAENLPFSTPQEALILASIVEKETGKPEERRRIAGVFINRLRQGIPLQTDPTVIYALTQGRPEKGGQGPLGRRLLKKDLSVDSPYNTYLHPGLPPGPIANPGRAAIEAVLNPEAHDFLYFVADGTGGHVFGRTLEEHARNVAAWRKKRKP